MCEGRGSARKQKESILVEQVYAINRRMRRNSISMKSNKSPGENEVTEGNSSCGDEIVIDDVYELVGVIWNTNLMPQQ